MIIILPDFHGHLGPALFYLFGMIGCAIYARRMTSSPSTDESRSERRWREYAEAHTNRDNKAGDPIKPPHKDRYL